MSKVCEISTYKSSIQACFTSFVIYLSHAFNTVKFNMRVKKDMKRVKRCENRTKTVSRCLKYNGQKITWDQFKSAFH